MSSSEHVVLRAVPHVPAPVVVPDDVGQLRARERVPGTRYVVVRMVGQGGMGEVYEVEHDELGRRAALKVLHRRHRGRPDLAARMREEARRLALLRHPNLVDVFDLGVTPDGRPFFAMELLAGRDLRAELSRFGVLAIPTALGLVAQALEGLGAAHAAGLVHRDVKLENLFLCDDGAVKVLDFGVAKVLGIEDGGTLDGCAVGTPRTMAPEQCAFAPVDPRADVYAAGLALYELVAGRGPFDDLRGNHHALRYAHCTRTPPPPSELAAQPIPAELEACILRAIAKSPEDRFASAREMADELRRLRGDRRRARDVLLPRPRATAAPAAERLEETIAARSVPPAPTGSRGLRAALRVAALAFARTILDDGL